MIPYYLEMPAIETSLASPQRLGLWFGDVFPLPEAIAVVRCHGGEEEKR